MIKDKSLSITRARVLSCIKKNEPIPIYEIVEKLKLPRSTIIHHLEQLKIRKLILEKSAKSINGKKELGSPIYLITNKKNSLLNEMLKICNNLLKVFS